MFSWRQWKLVRELIGLGGKRIMCVVLALKLSFSRERGFREILLFIQFCKEVENAQTTKIVPQTVSNTDGERWY